MCLVLASIHWPQRWLMCIWMRVVILNATRPLASGPSGSVYGCCVYISWGGTKEWLSSCHCFIGSPQRFDGIE